MWLTLNRKQILEMYDRLHQAGIVHMDLTQRRIRLKDNDNKGDQALSDPNLLWSIGFDGSVPTVQLEDDGKIECEREIEHICCLLG